MNIIDIQDQLKNFSEQQLISEMQMPTGSAPQFLVLGEIKRRKRVRDDFMKREAANQPTVAEEAIAAAGVPQSGIRGMSEAMAPQAAVAEGGIGSIMPQSMRPQTMPAPTDDAIPMAEGGVIRAKIGAFFNPDGTPTEAGIRALIAQESGGDPKARGSLDEVGIGQIRPSTALMPGYGVQSMFPEITAKIGEGKEYATADEAYLANKDLIDAGLEDVGMSTRFAKDYLTAMSKQFPDDPNRALAAYNVGPGTAAKLENPAEFDYVTSVLGRMDDGSDEPGTISKIVSALNPISTAQAQGAGPVLTEVEEDTKVRDFEGRVIGDTSIGPRLRENPNPGSYVFEEGDELKVIDDTMAPDERRLLNEMINMGRNYEFMYKDRDPDDLGNVGMDSSALGMGAITGSTAGMSPDQIAEVNPVPASTDVNRASESGTSVLQAGSKEDKITFPEQTTNVEGDTTTVEGDTTTLSPTTIVGGESGTYDASGLAAEIKSLQDKLDKDRETDKYLALAQAGLALMSSKEPTLLGAVGEAGISGLTAFREAQDRYQEGVVDLINARAKLKGKGSSFTTNQMIQRAGDLQTMAKNLKETDGSEAALQRARELEIAAQGLLVQAGVIGGESSAIAGFQDQ
jgi:hypothetical protein